jgi:uncharacterized protein YneF (UPF0154 family)
MSTIWWTYRAAPRALQRFDWLQIARYAPLVGILVAAVAAYFPALDSPFWGDDYTYLQAVRNLSVLHYTRVAVVPGSNDRTLIFTSDFWRPLYFLSFEPMERFFGPHVVYYHLVNLTIHLFGIILVWVLGQRLTGRWLAAGVAAAIFAVHPVAIDSVTWISSVNSVALPLGLGGWLCFISAIERPATRLRRRRMLSASVLLFIVSVGFRETGVVFFMAMALWYLLIPARARLLQWRTYLPLVPFVILGIVYLLVRTRFFTIPAANSEVNAVDIHIFHHAFGYLEFAFFPATGLTNAPTGWETAIEKIGAIVILLAIPIALVTKRWLLLALVVGFIVSVLPYSADVFGAQTRYFYFPSALFALAAGAATVEMCDVARRAMPARVPLTAVGFLLLAGLIGVGYVANLQVRQWVNQNPKVNEAWVDQLRARYPTLPAGGTLYLGNAPFLLRIFGGYIEESTVHFYYPHIGDVVDCDLQPRRCQGEPDAKDRIFIYQPGN